MSDLLAAPFWERNLIYRVLSGSRSYGLEHAGSDEDTRGVCIPPKEYLLGLESFEQYEDETQNHTVFGLAKVVRLALDANPNIIETLHTDPRHVLFINAYGERLVSARSIFLSKRVGERFTGYAVDQLGRMERHHRWLVDPPDHMPQPDEFGAKDIGGATAGHTPTLNEATGLLFAIGTSIRSGCTIAIQRGPSWKPGMAMTRNTPCTSCACCAWARRFCAMGLCKSFGQMPSGCGPYGRAP